LVSSRSQIVNLDSLSPLPLLLFLDSQSSTVLSLPHYPLPHRPSLDVSAGLRWPLPLLFHLPTQGLHIFKNLSATTPRPSAGMKGDAPSPPLGFLFRLSFNAGPESFPPSPSFFKYSALTRCFPWSFFRCSYPSGRLGPFLGWELCVLFF